LDLETGWAVRLAGWRAKARRYNALAAMRNPPELATF